MASPAVILSMGDRRFVSLQFELAELTAAVRGARLLLDHLQMPSATRTREERDALAGGRAMLTVVAERLDLVQRALRGEVDPRLLFSDVNATDGDPHDEDHLLRPWSHDEQNDHHEGELHRLRIASGRRRGRGRAS